MRFLPTTLSGVVLVRQEAARDDRGYFARSFCVREFAAAGLETCFVQHSVSHTSRRGTVRGMHFQREPHAEVKLVSCIRGAIRDVLVDLRPTSPSYMLWEGFDLVAGDGTALHVPKGVAHGFQTLAPDTAVGYMISAFHEPAAAAGVRHDDPAFGIRWPLPVAMLSEKDRAWPDYAA